MRLKLAIIAALMLVLMGVSDTGKQLTADIAVSNTTGSSQTAVIAPFPMNPSALLASNAIGADGLTMEMQDSALGEVPFSPSPTETAWEACRVVNAGVPADETSDCNDAGPADITLLPATGADLETTDGFYFGAHHPFRIIEIDIDTAGVFVTDPAIIWEYCTAAVCASWTALTNVADGTEGFTTTGTRSVTWDIPDDWSEFAYDGDTSYWVRARVTALVTSANYTTQPLGDISTYQMGVGFLFPCDTCDPTSASFTAKTLANNQSITYELFTGQDTARTNHVYFPNRTTGIPAPSWTTSAGDWSVRLIGGFDPFNSGATRNLIDFSAGGSFIRWDAANDGELDVFIDAGADCNLNDTATGISDYGRHTILIEFDSGTHCRIVVDAVEVAIDLTYTGPMAAVASGVIAEEGSMYWIEQATYSAGNIDPDTSTTWELEILDLSTDFTALMIENQTGGTDFVPTFPDITEGFTATAGGFTSATSVVGAVGGEDVPDVLGVVDAPVRFAIVAQPTVTLPGAPAVQELADTAGIPSYLIWAFGGALASIAALVFTFRFTQSFMLSITMAGIVVVVIFSMSIFPMWVIFPVAVLGAAIMILGKGFTVGA